MEDKSPYVRKTAVMGVVKLHYIAPEIVAGKLIMMILIIVFHSFPSQDLNFVDVLYQMLRDKDPQVISNCISALDEILANEGGMVVTKKIIHYLINR